MPVQGTPFSQYSSATSVLFTWTMFTNKYGLKNIASVSNKDATSTTPNYAACQDAFDLATQEVYNAFTGGVYAVPLNFIDGIVPPVVARWAMTIAYAELYFARGMDDNNKYANKMQKAVSAAYLEMAMFRSGMRQLPNAAGNAANADGSIDVVKISDVLLANGSLRFVDGVPIWR